MAGPKAVATLRSLGALGKPLPPPREEIVPRGRRHSIRRDKVAVSHHYDVGNEFYALRARPVDDVLVRPVRRRRDVVRGGPGGQARADLPQARPARTSRRPTARRRMRLGVDGDPRRHPPRRAGRRCDDQQRAGGRGTAAGRSRWRVRPGGDPDRGLPAGRRRSVRRDLIGRHGRARRRTQDGRLLRHPALAAPARRADAEPRHLGGRRIAAAPARFRLPLRVPRWRTARCRQHRAVDGAGGVRGARRREPPRALRGDVARMGRQSGTQLGPGGRPRRRRPGPRLVAVHVGLDQQLRRQRHRHPPGARRRHRTERRQPHAPHAGQLGRRKFRAARRSVDQAATLRATRVGLCERRVPRPLGSVPDRVVLDDTQLRVRDRPRRDPQRPGRPLVKP